MKNIGGLITMGTALLLTTAAGCSRSEQSAATNMPAVAQSAPVSGATVEITVSQGTNMAAAAAPDGSYHVIGLQGLLWKLPAEGGTAQAITSWDLEAVRPVISPDSRSIAFYSYKGGSFHIWMMAADGSALKQLTDGPYDDREPSWSPDGSKLAFGSDRGGTRSYDIWTIEVQSGKLEQRTKATTEEFQPTWSPDGKEIAFVEDGKAIVAVDAAGARRTLASAASGTVDAPSWGAAAADLVYVERAANTPRGPSTPRLMMAGTALTTNEDVFPFPVSWLKDRRFVYTSDGKLRTRQVGEAAPKDIAFQATLKLNRPTYTPKSFPFDSDEHQILGISQPRLSPDGTTVLFKALNDIWVMKIGDAPRQLTNDHSYESGVTWSKDGRQIVYSSDKAGTPDVWIRDVASGRDQRITSLPGAEYTPALSPDGRTVVFQNEGHDWAVADVQSKATKPLIEGITNELLGRPTWSPDSKYMAYADIVRINGRFREGYLDIRAVNVATGEAVTYPPAEHKTIADRGDSGPVWSPDGTAMAFIMDSTLWVIPVDGVGKPTGAARQITRESSDNPSWSGDSKTLMYLSNGKLKTVGADGGQARDIPVALTFKQAAPAGTTVIHAGRLWDGTGESVRENVDVLITGNRITSIAPHAAAAHTGARVIDATNKTVIPGLIEAHHHPQHEDGAYGGRYGRIWLSYGVTSIFSMGGQAYEAIEGREAAWANKIIGPRAFETGQLFDGSRLSHPEVRAVSSPEQMKLELGRAEALKFDLLKAYVRLPAELMAEMAAFGHDKLGVVTVGHLLSPGIQTGTDGTSHFATQRLPFNWMQSHMGVSYDDVQQILTKGKYTVVTGGSGARLADQPSLAEDPRVRTLFPPWDQEVITRTAKTPFTEDMRANIAPGIKKYADLYRGGTLVTFGTDTPLTYPALSLHMVMRGFVDQGGLQPWQVLEMATKLAARYIGAEKDLGTIEAGKIADIAIVDGNPLTNFRDVINTVGAMKNGNYYTVSELMQPYARTQSTD